MTSAGPEKNRINLGEEQLETYFKQMTLDGYVLSNFTVMKGWIESLDSLYTIVPSETQKK